MVLMMRFLAAIIVWLIVILAAVGSLGLYMYISLYSAVYFLSILYNVAAYLSSAFILLRRQASSKMWMWQSRLLRQCCNTKWITNVHQILIDYRNLFTTERSSL